MVKRGMPQFRIRKGIKSDWPEISKISASVAEEGVIGDYINDIGEPYMDRGMLYVAVADRVIGFQHVQDVPDGSIYLSGLRILKEYRRMGIARALISQSITDWQGRGKQFARAFVEQGNNASMSLMSSLGFRRVADMNLYFGFMDLAGFSEVGEWPDCYVDIGRVPSKAFPGVNAKLYRRGNCLVSRSPANKWDGQPTFSVLNYMDCSFSQGTSFITSAQPIPKESLGGLDIIPKFERANLMELKFN